MSNGIILLLIIISLSGTIIIFIWALRNYLNSSTPAGYNLQVVRLLKDLGEYSKYNRDVVQRLYEKKYSVSETVQYLLTEDRE